MPRNAYPNNVNTYTIRIGSRGSQLALWQANHILAAARRPPATPPRSKSSAPPATACSSPASSPPPPRPAPPRRQRHLHQGDRRSSRRGPHRPRRPLAQGSSHHAAPQFTLAAIPPRVDARDVWVCEPYWGLHTLPSDGTIGTTSPRRRAQLLALRPDVRFVEMRGNIDTRLRKLAEGQCDALVLACAGLDRLGHTEHVHYRFASTSSPPPPGQGALALETRSAGLPFDTDDPTPRSLHLPGRPRPQRSRRRVRHPGRTHRPQRARRRLPAAPRRVLPSRRRHLAPARHGRRARQQTGRPCGR